MTRHESNQVKKQHLLNFFINKTPIILKKEFATQASPEEKTNDADLSTLSDRQFYGLV